jgi:HEAT repeat protein
LVPLLRERLKPPAIDAKWLKQALDGLDSADFGTRQRANIALEKLGDHVESALREAQGREPSLEVKRRVAALSAKLDSPSPERLARWRALEALEQMASPEAVRLLDALAGGAPGARLTRDAAAVRDRVQRRLGGKAK